MLACRTALRIRENLDALNGARDVPTMPRLDAGIGINTGLCTVGNFGSTHRFDYSAVGDPVNVASRLESATRAHDHAILLGTETARRVPSMMTRAIGPVVLRGRVGTIDVYALIGEKPSA